MMGFVSLGVSKAILAICNFFLLISGFALIFGGILLLFDADRILLSRLLTNNELSTAHYPLLYYAAIGITCLGLILALIGVLGCWASCMHSYWMLALYFLLIIFLLIGELVIFTFIWIWPHCVGLGLNPDELIKSIQNNYGKDHHEDFTVAVDLAQTTFECCGVESANEYDTSLWRLQSLGHNLAVPLTCCKLSNANDAKAHLNPVPVNVTLCQALEISRHEEYRHHKGCHEALDFWFGQQYVIVIIAALILIMIEFVVLLSTILSCTRIYQYKHECKANKKAQNQRPAKSEAFRRSPITAYTTDTYALNDSFRQKYNVVDTV